MYVFQQSDVGSYSLVKYIIDIGDIANLCTCYFNSYNGKKIANNIEITFFTQKRQNFET